MSSQEIPENILNQSFSTNDVGSSFKTISDENSQEMLTEPISTSELNVMFSHPKCL
jgi:hypothetical protein